MWHHQLIYLFICHIRDISTASECPVVGGNVDRLCGSCQEIHPGLVRRAVGRRATGVSQILWNTLNNCQAMSNRATIGMN